MNGRAGAAVKYLPILLVMVFWGSMGEIGRAHV